MPKDPICGMKIDPKKAEAKRLTARRQGKKYYFCSKQCHNEFAGKNKPASRLMQKEGSQTCTIKITGMTCASCVARVEKVLTKFEGIEKVNVNLATETVSLDISDNVDLKDVAKAIEDYGYKLHLPEEKTGKTNEHRLKDVEDQHYSNLKN